MEKVYKIDGMSCHHCVMAVKKEISKLDIKSLEVKIGEAKVQFDETKIKPESIKQSIITAGYSVIE